MYSPNWSPCSSAPFSLFSVRQPEGACGSRVPSCYSSAQNPLLALRVLRGAYKAFHSLSPSTSLTSFLPLLVHWHHSWSSDPLGMLPPQTSPFALPSSLLRCHLSETFPNLTTLLKVATLTSSLVFLILIHFVFLYSIYHILTYYIIALLFFCLSLLSRISAPFVCFVS